MTKTQVLDYASFAVLIAGLALSTVMPEVSSVAFFVLAALGLLLLPRSAAREQIIASPSVFLPLLGGALILIALLFTTRDPSNLLPVLLFMPLLLIAPVAAVLANGRRVTADHIALCALAGSLAAVALAIIDGRILGISRAGQSVNNPIHFAAASVVIGFLALVGLHSARGLIRKLALLGPIFGLVAVVLSGSRGPLLAFPAMLVTALLVLLFQHARPRLAWSVTVALAVVGAAVLAWMWYSPAALDLKGVGDVIVYLRDGAVRDSSSGERAMMYQGGILAIMDSPWVGHGAGFVGAAADLSPDPVAFPRYDHLHSDLLDFGAMAGVPGLIAYLLFIVAAPIGSCFIRNQHNRTVAQLLAFPTAAGYVVLGLTNATIGVIAQTIVLAVVCVLVTYLSTAAALSVEDSSSQDR